MTKREAWAQVILAERSMYDEDAYQEGWDAQVAGKQLSASPYLGKAGPANVAAKAAWRQGWLDARDDATE